MCIGLILYAEESLNVMKYFGMAKMALRRNSMLVWRTESTCPLGDAQKKSLQVCLSLMYTNGKIFEVIAYLLKACPTYKACKLQTILGC